MASPSNSRIWCLHLLGAPSGNVGLAHVAGGLDRGDKLEGDVGNTDNANDATGNFGEEVLAENQAADKDVDCVVLAGQLQELTPEVRLTGATSGEGEQERGIARHLRRDLELCDVLARCRFEWRFPPHTEKTNGRAKDYHVDCDNDVATVCRVSTVQAPPTEAIRELAQLNRRRSEGQTYRAMGNR